MSHSKQNRREFLGKMALGVAEARASVPGSALSAPPTSGEMPYRTLAPQ